MRIQINLSLQIILFALVLPQFMQAQRTALDAKMGEVIITGKIGNINPPMQLWIYMGEEKWDTIPIKNGKFKYRKKTMLPAYGAMVVRYKPVVEGEGSFFANSNMLSMFFENGKMKVNAPVDSLKGQAVVKGSRMYSRHQELWDKEGAIVREQRSLAMSFNQGSPEQLQSVSYQKYYESQNELLLKKWDSLIKAEVSKYPASYHTYIGFLNYQRQRNPPDEVSRPIAMMISPAYRGKAVEAVDYYVQMKKFEENARKVGDIAPGFEQNDIVGNAVKLADFRGQYVLLDFWASWCLPCRKANPDLVKLYQEFKDQNFEILAVSLDEDKEKWADAINADGLTWRHVSDLKGYKNAVVELYGIGGIPQNFLIDPAGKIVAVNLEINDLKATLEKLVKK